MYIMLMSISHSELLALTNRVARLEQLLAKITGADGKPLERLLDRVKSLEGQICGSEEEFEVHTNALVQIHTRLNKIESKLFPNLAKDLEKLGSVIGRTSPIAHNPLDYRKKKRPKT